MKPIPMRVCVSLLLASGVLFTTAAQLRDDEIANKIDTFVKEIMNCYSGSGITLSVVKSGKTIMSRGYGNIRNPKGNEDVKVNSQTRFGIGSLTKAFTGLLAVKLASESKGAVTMDTPIHGFMPSFRFMDDVRTKEASLKDLLSHRMTFPKYMWPFIIGFSQSVTRKDLFRRMPFLPSPYTFREKHMYNNYMYIVAGEVLEHLAHGKSWEDIVRDDILSPLKMSNTGFLTDKDAFVDNFALPCYRAEDGSITDLTTGHFITYRLDGPAGSMYSNADDMTKWMNLMLSKGQRANPSGLGHEITKQAFYAGSRLSDGPMSGKFKPEFPVSMTQSAYAMGWTQNSYRGYRQVDHGGEIVTHGSKLWLYPDMDIGIFISNRGAQNIFQDEITSIVFYASDLLLRENNWFDASSACLPSPPFRPANTTAKGYVESQFKPFDSMSDTIVKFNAKGTLVPAHYVGNYTHPFFGVVEINYCADDGNEKSLCFYNGGYGWMSMSAVSETTFAGRVEGPLIYLDPSRRQYYMMATFSLNDLGFATSVSLVQEADDAIEYKKVDDVKDSTNKGLMAIEYNVCWQISTTIIGTCFLWLMI